MHKIDALGVSIAYVHPGEALAHVQRFLQAPRFHQVATVNPDFIMQARNHKHFSDVLNSVDLALADGVGIHLPTLLQGQKPLGRIPGADLTEYILNLAQKMKLSVFLLARTDGLSSVALTKAAIHMKYPLLKVRGLDVNIHSEESLRRAFSLIDGHVVLANFGAPLQDTYLASLRQSTRDIRLVMGVGGTFDFITGRQKRAPAVLRTLGLEWLWRLLCKPVRRFKRTWNYVIVYTFLCFRYALGNFFYQTHLRMQRSLWRLYTSLTWVER